MTDYNKYFEGVTGYICRSCGLFFETWDEKSFKDHLEKTTCKKETDEI